MCSPNCERVAATILGSAVVQLSGGKTKKCCRGVPQNHKGGCISPDPKEFFPDDRAPHKVQGAEQDCDEKDASKPVQCPCGKTMAACA